MQGLFNIYRKNLSLRLSLRVVAAMNILLMVTLFAMFFYSRKVIKEDTLQRASQTLEGAMTKIDNILLSVEETTGNMYFDMQPHLNNPDAMYEYSRRIVETCPYITGCAIAFKPGFYEGRESFMAYYHRRSDASDAPTDSLIVREETFGNKPYYEQVWFTKPIETYNAMWLNPLEGMDDIDIEPITSYSLPIPDGNGKPIGVISVDVSLSLISDIVATTKTSPDSYCALLDSDGTFIVHPTGKHLRQPTAYGLPDDMLKNILGTVMSGETSYAPFNIAGKDFYIFYKPFQRALIPMRPVDKSTWTIAVAMSKESIFGEYNRLFNYVVINGLGGMLLFLLVCWIILFLSLRPLKMLTGKAERIAEGHYREPIPKTWNRDEIGSLQRNFIRMRRALVAQIDELEQLTAANKQRSEELNTAYKQAQKADQMKTVFLHRMTNQMVDPALAIDNDVTALRANDAEAQKRDTAQLVDNIQKNGTTITRVLNQLLNQSEEEIRKEVEHD